MKVLGLIVEHNPFHNGHLYHLNKAKEIVKPDFTIAVMSGNFCQRGEPAIIDKFSRAEIALKNGIDVVFELPVVYALQDAGGFAYGAISLLDKLKTVTDIVFGSESADKQFITEVAKTLSINSKEFDKLLKKELKKGMSFPNARKFALKEFLKKDVNFIKKIENSNDILGIEYVKSILKLNSNIKYNVIKRIGARYNELNLTNKYSSATAIRNAIKMDKEFKEFVPDSSYEILKHTFLKGKGPVFLEDMEQFILTFLRLKRREDLKKTYSFNEGLDQRFINAIKNSTTLSEFFDNVKTKRFTYSRIRRAIFHAIFNFEKEYIDFSNKLGVQYARILGFTRKGQKLLSKIKNVSKIPIISNPSLKDKILKKALSSEKFEINKCLFNWQFEKDILASNIYTMFYPKKTQRKYGVDFRKPIIIEGENERNNYRSDRKRM
ncbi:hypothetical protein BG95_00820 [Thermosipho sp. 1063]|uniref:nucleotidyltransferase n=1 Tax=unclassified Thermosipho (in: thermotogales) TaxID=2676525 RepID=UPI0009494627|nr:MULTISPECIES: nucleotidyltransferase [unclassified Thermosipho (in: thermotogales)]ANQ53079.1 hypothetical protein Y592_00825 [Thermosipho sp. 1070]APT71528.1 hypothetical protein BG95_00820 [Thermosipho sp. 1063]